MSADQAVSPAQVARNTLLVELLLAIAKAPTLDRLLSDAIGQVKWLLDFEFCALALCEGDCETYRVRSLFHDGETAPASAALTMPSGLAGEVIATGQVRTLVDPAPGVVELPPGIEQDEGEALRSVLTVPLRAFDVVVGAITFGKSQPDAYGGSDIELAVTICTHLALAIDRHRATVALEAREKHLRAIYQSTGAGIVMIDREGVFVQTNAAFEHMIGYSAEELGGMTTQQVTHPDDMGLTNRRFHDLIAGRIESHRTEKRFLRRDGSTVWVDLVGTALTDDAGTVQFILGTMQDVTEKRRAAEELRAAKEAAERASLGKSQFLANMSHEIRTPLNGVLGIAGLLSKTELDAQQGRFVDIIQSSGRSLLRVINDILDFSKIEAGKLTIDAAPFDLHTVVREAVELYSQTAQAKSLLVSASIADDVPHHVIGDPHRLGQILGNLISNAIKFTEQGWITVRLECAMPEGAGEIIRFKVEDTGVGIDREHQERLFAPFEQVDGSASRRYEGTGLGLSIVRALVEMMGGEISVQSTVGRGSTFAFEVPFKVADSEAIAVESGENETPSAFHARVLLAEDNLVNQEVARAALLQLGCDVSVAANGVEAYDAWEATLFDAILMDCQMPEMDGFEATARIRKAEQRGAGIRTPIIALTAHALKGDRERCLAAGMDDYLAKPFDANELARVLHRWLTDRAVA